MARIAKCKRCGGTVDVVWEELQTYQLLIDSDGTPFSGALLEGDSNGGEQEGYYCNGGCDYIDSEDIVPGDEITPLEDGESSIDLDGGYRAVFQSANANPRGTEYVRIVDPMGRELVYWDQQEWAEDPACVMGALMAAMSCPSRIREVTERVSF